MPEGRNNKVADLQETKFLRLFGLTNLSACISLYNSISIMPFWHDIHSTMLLDHISLIMQVC